MSLRTVALVGVLGLAAGWAMGSRYASQTPAAADLPSRGPRPLGVEGPFPAPALTDQLRHKLDRLTSAPAPVRNPFVFGQRPAVRTTPAPGTTPAEVEPDQPTVTAAPTPPTYTLSGIATTHADEGDRFTAILGGSFGMQFAGPGDALPGGWVVLGVTETTVNLRDAAGAERTLSLR